MEIVGKKSQGLRITALRDDDTVIVTFKDPSLNFYVSDSLKDSLKEQVQARLDEGYRHVVLNLDAVKVIDSCGVGLIIVANNLVMASDANLYLSNVKPFIVKILEIMRISSHLAIFESEADALAAVKAAGPAAH